MAESANPTPSHPRYAPFHRVQQPFYTLRETPLIAEIFVPKNIPSNSSPAVIVNFHGGGLVTGARDLADWWAQWTLDLAVAHNAIIISPDYPLAPESKSPEILAGIKQFFTWLLDGPGLQEALDADTVTGRLRLAAATEKLLVVGESAGGWVGLHSGLLYADRIRGLVLRFPMLDLENDWYTTTRVNDELWGIAGMLKSFNPAESLVDDYVAGMKPGAVRVRGGISPEWPVADAALLYGRVPGLVGLDSDETYPLRALEKGDGVRLPEKIWLLHGKEDSVVAEAGSAKLEKLVRENVKGTELKYDTAPGDHGFDGSMTLDETALPMKERLDWLQTSWLR